VTPAARVQASIELLDLIIAAARENGPAADTIIANWFKTRRFAGSKDRRAIRDHVYSAIRAFGMMPKTGRMAMIGLTKGDKELAALFDGTPYGPAVIEDGEQRVARSPLAPWLGALIDPAEHDALLERAPLDIRVNSLSTTRERMLEQFEGAQPIAGTRDGLAPARRHGGRILARLPRRADRSAGCRIAADRGRVRRAAGDDRSSIFAPGQAARRSRSPSPCATRAA
jgi:16S rRNA (cytosine967-C5)-methyltransferase